MTDILLGFLGIKDVIPVRNTAAPAVRNSREKKCLNTFVPPNILKNTS